MSHKAMSNEPIAPMSAEQRLADAFAEVNKAGTSMADNAHPAQVARLAKLAEKLVWTCSDELPEIFATLASQRTTIETRDAELAEWRENIRELTELLHPVLQDARILYLDAGKRPVNGSEDDPTSEWARLIRAIRLVDGALISAKGGIQ